MRNRNLLPFDNVTGGLPLPGAWPIAGPVLLESLTDLARRKCLFGLSESPDLLVPVGKVVELNDKSVRTIVTSSVDEYKDWIGRPDAQADNHAWAMPTQHWSGRRFADKAQLSAVEAENIEKAGWVYLFNDSRLVSSYAQAIEDYNGVFEASLYHFRRVIVQPGARLVLRGRPALLLIDELEVQGSGQLETYTTCHASLGHVRKTAQQVFLNN